ncbi:DJ-1/PfpI family protein [Herbiconiux daphne]|uniref:DJ-1/PfpI family protein n=1 Tax=Herbiconiux daphne TaxID=2970914 RepID=A0ABT2H539_9MICO|nr:DJ-1/PfpI family protein [Herbiconiux daphne]MCS5735050.1 DJ-1/PfpI family protein [Herbiconiux daphne]
MTVKTIGILLFENVEELDAFGPWEVLSFWTLKHPEDGYEVRMLADSLDPVRCAKGLRVLPDTTLTDAPPLDVLIYPGGQGTRPRLEDAAELDWLRGQRETVPLITSVCTGALVLAAAGILNRRPATTHWQSVDLLAELDPSIELRPDARFVDDGDVITASGVSAGIDMALHLVDRLAGRERAVEVRRGIQYDPAPPV